MWLILSAIKLICFKARGSDYPRYCIVQVCQTTWRCAYSLLVPETPCTNSGDQLAMFLTYSCSQKRQLSLLQTVSCVPVLFALLSLRMPAMSSITAVLSSVGTESGSLTMSYRHALDHIPTQSYFVQG